MFLELAGHIYEGITNTASNPQSVRCQSSLQRHPNQTELVITKRPARAKTTQSETWRRL